MSRSRKKTPISGVTTAPSDKPFKSDEHRRERRHVRTVLTHSQDGDDKRLHGDWGNPWKAPKDGKTFGADPKDMRK